MELLESSGLVLGMPSGHLGTVRMGQPEMTAGGKGVLQNEAKGKMF